MELFELNKISRFYLVNKKKKYVLKDISLSLPSTGLITILGKSGCGKSTLLNLLGKIDNQSEGTIYFNNENFTKCKEKQLSIFRSQAISFIFQHYHLLDNQSALFNIMLPCLIGGDSFYEAREKALILLREFNMNEELYRKKTADLSGGERERIAILRAFINEPKVILADEPTGALDKNNAVLVMEALKKTSQSSLVILVTHNKKLAYQYSDRILHMHDGRIVQDERIKPIKVNDEKIKIVKHKRSNGWIDKIIANNFIKRLKRNIFSIFALAVGLISTMLIVGFSNGKESSIITSLEKQFDYGTASINKENKIVSSDSPITLIQSIRPNEEEIEDLNYDYPEFDISYSYDALLSPYPEIYFNDSLLEELSFIPIHSFVDNSINHNLLIKGKIPTFDTLNQVLINQRAYEYINQKLKYDCLDSYIRIKDQHSYSFYTDNIENPYITDYFVFDRLVQIVGVVNEISFLNTPKIYYSYQALDKYLDSVYLNNLSAYLGQISWKQRVIEASNNEDISSYTCRLFLKDINQKVLLKSVKETIKDYAITSNAITVEETLLSLVDAASIGMDVFLGIALIGVALIIGIISFASYNEDIKDSAILLCLGAKREDIALIYIIETMLLGLIGILLSFISAILLTKPINSLITHFTSLENIIVIPFYRFLNRPFLFPFLIIVGTLLICILSTYLPIAFSKNISLKEELKAND